MKFLIPSVNWEGGTIDFFGKALQNLGHEVRYCYKKQEKDISKLSYFLKLRHFKKFYNYINYKIDHKFNKDIISSVREIKPDLFLSLNSRIFPETVEYIKNKNIQTVCIVHDYPFDSTRFKYFPYSLQYFDYIFIADKIWTQSIKNLAPNAKLYSMVGAYPPDIFKPIQINNKDYAKYNCNLGFAGASYGIKAEGAYRAGILSQISKYGLKIWGDSGWKNYVAKYYPNLSNAYEGDRLNFDELNKLYQITKININLPNPQCLTTFQQRTFEIAAAKGFQIVDYRPDLEKYFADDEIVTFKNISELKKKIKYFLKYPEKRKLYIEKAFERVKNNHTYEERVQNILERIDI